MPAPTSSISSAVTAETRLEFATIRLMRFGWSGGIDVRIEPQPWYWVDQCITPRPPGLQACFPERTGGHSFLPVGDLIVVPPGEVLHVRTEGDASGNASGQQESIVCCLDPQAVERWHDGPWRHWKTEALDVRDQGIRGLLWRLIREVTDPGAASRASLELLSGLIAIELSRYCARISHAFPQGGLAAWRLRLIDERLKQPGKPPALPELAALCKISVRQLMRGFSVSRNSTLGAYIEAARLSRAQRLLAEGAKITQVAQELGFASAASFCGAFKRRTGVSPGEYRRRA